MFTHRYEVTVEFGRPLDHPRDEPERLADLARKHAAKYRQLPGGAPDLTLDGYHLRTLAGETA